MIAQNSNAQRLIAITSALSSTRESAKLYAHSVDLDAQSVLQAPIPLSGTTPEGPLVALPDGSAALISTRPELRPGGRRAPGDRVDVLGTAPLAALRSDAPRREPRWHYGIAAVLAGDARGDSIVVELGKPETEELAEGVLEARTWHGTTPAAESARHALHARPIALAAWRDDGAIPTAAVLCTAPGRDAAQIVAIDIAGGEERSGGILPPADALDVRIEPVALALSTDHARLFVLMSGIALSPQRGHAVSWLYAVSPGTLETLGPPLELDGVGIDPGALQAAGPLSCWAVTRTPGSDFAAVSLAVFDETTGALRREQEYPQGGVLERALCAPAPGAPGSYAAFAFDRRVTFWSSGVLVSQHVFEQPVRAMRWESGGLVVGEGNRIHRMDMASATPSASVSIPSGWIVDWVAMPPGPADDAEHPAPRLSAPREFLLRGEAAGHELRAIPIDTANGADVAWRIEIEKTAAPWLILYPRTGRGNGVAYAALDPSRYDPAQHSAAGLRVRAIGGAAAPEAQELDLRVFAAPPRGGHRRILWLWGYGAEGKAPMRDAADPHWLKGLGDLLAAAPFYFSHDEHAGPFEEPLEPYGIVVLSASAAAEGVLTRQAVLEYVAAGGALLFLGAYLGETPGAGLEHWLGPMNILIDTSMRVSGRYAGAGDNYLLRHWNDFEIKDGCAIRAESGHALAPGKKEGGGAVIVARDYGYGRVALLAGATPLESPAIQGQDERAFAADVFRWLARAGLDINDLDGDGLPDEMEDRDNNGRRDAGESDFLRADTDNDGIPDGTEDRDRNGVVDPDETDPRNPDSDGDGLLDGADPAPAPAYGTPTIARVEVPGGKPAEGPAEGGNIVLIHGSNIPPDAQFWFGARIAPWRGVINSSQALARVPDAESEHGGSVAVHVSTPSSGRGRELPDGYRYTERSGITLTLLPGPAALHESAALHGTIRVEIAPEAPEKPQRIVMLLRVDPAGGFAWGDVGPGAALGNQAKAIDARKLEDGRLLVSLRLPDGRTYTPGELLHIGWSLAKTPKESPSVRVDGVSAVTRSGGRLRASLTSARLWVHSP